MKSLICSLLFFALGVNIHSQTEDVPAAKDSLSESMLIGDCTRQDFQDTSFAGRFNKEYSEYSLETAIADSLKEIIDGLEIVIINGTWCSDSKREIPRFFKVLDYINYPSEKLIMKCVDRKLKTLNSDVDKYHTESVPTIIFYKEGKELGRIIEAPDESLEKDMFEIISKE